MTLRCGRNRKSVVFLFQFGKVCSQLVDSGFELCLLFYEDVNQPTQVTCF